MKKWLKIILLFILMIGLIPLDSTSQDIFLSDAVWVEITDNVVKVSLRDPHPTYEYDKWFETNEYWSLWSYDATLWSLTYRKDNGTLNNWRVTIPGYSWQWWALGRYVPVLKLDFDSHEDGNEFYIAIFTISKSNHCGSHYSLSWSNINGFSYFHCTEE